MKKLLAVLLSLCLVVGMLPMMAFADELSEDEIQTQTNDSPAEDVVESQQGTEITDKETFLEAYEAAKDGDTLTISETASTISFQNKFTIDKSITIVGGAFTGNSIIIGSEKSVKFSGSSVSNEIIVESGADVSGFEAYGYVYVTIHGDETITYYMSPRSVKGVIAAIQSGNNFDMYQTLNDALRDASPNDTVVVFGDSAESNITVPDGVKLVINTGVTIAGPITAPDESSIVNNGEVTNGINYTEPETPPIQPLRYSVEFDVNPYWANASIVVEDESGNVVKPNGNGEYWLEAGELYYYIVRANGFNDAVGNIDADYAWDTITVNLSLNGPIVVWPYSHGYVEYWISHSRDWAGVRVEPDSGYYLDDLTIYKVGGGTVNYGHWRDNIYYFPLYAGEQYIIDADFASAPSEYRVYVDSSILHGDVSVDTVYAEEGEWVYITVDPDVGYRLYNLTVTRPSGNTVKVEHVRDNVYRFSMPGVRVTVDAEFIRTVTPFTDVRLADWFYEYVSFAYRYGLMEGINSYQFAPDATATRAMVVQILYRMSGEPAVSYGSGFTDVASNAWYADAIAWAARNNIVNGTSAATFDPNAPVTREQFATMLYRYARYRGFNTSLTANILSYYDVNQVSEYAFEALQWACAEGIVNGTSTGYLTPQGNATRAQLAAMLMRFCNEYFDL